MGIALLYVYGHVMRIALRLWAYWHLKLKTRTKLSITTLRDLAWLGICTCRKCYLHRVGLQQPKSISKALYVSLIPFYYSLVHFEGWTHIILYLHHCRSFCLWERSAWGHCTKLYLYLLRSRPLSSKGDLSL
jgi:hypothetical protein